MHGGIELATRPKLTINMKLMIRTNACIWPKLTINMNFCCSCIFVDISDVISYFFVWYIRCHSYFLLKKHRTFHGRVHRYDPSELKMNACEWKDKINMVVKFYSAMRHFHKFCNFSTPVSVHLRLCLPIHFQCPPYRSDYLLHQN